ncbi:hypothetical protein [Burkholderia glumae]|uniref:Uncharacterized protein n=1 Tax=Burkholderia glumae TaxID=337 RepID=A0AAP9XXW6_BURGL|nr:hypothetical protein [Burkholderia glumae]NVE24041.1 hypothetical protein [Burkholderia glumae]QGA40174.1 hypothetical protein GAS19_21710 [Burkholderia glumae]QJW80918.1 hypothetical protein GAS18_19570 [Burkholderia glumae]QPQ90648.1 hypothetical protein I6H06_02530 [Burkholderia glumae]QQM94478.1 hypothetical protein I6G78_22270 [Burkholderia glumae]
MNATTLDLRNLRRPHIRCVNRADIHEAFLKTRLPTCLMKYMSDEIASDMLNGIFESASETGAMGISARPNIS